MAAGQHLISAAFVLCGVLFLLQVNSVSSILCKRCLYSDPNCNSGDVTNMNCEILNVTNCITLTMRSGDRVYTVRGCTDIPTSWCNHVSLSSINCYNVCNTDLCNNQPVA